jgi:hypothetical protein
MMRLNKNARDNPLQRPEYRGARVDESTYGYCINLSGNAHTAPLTHMRATLRFSARSLEDPRDLFDAAATSTLTVETTGGAGLAFR